LAVDVERAAEFMNQLLPVLLADWEDALKGAGALLVLAYWIFSALSDAKKQAPAQPKARPQPPQPPGPANAGPADVPGRGAPQGPVAKPVQDNVRAEVEEFLRRVRQQGDPDRRPPKPAPDRRRPRIEVLVDDETGSDAAVPPGRTVAPSDRSTTPPLSRKESIPSGARREAAPDVLPPVESVPLEKRHLAGSGVAEHARHLGEQIGQLDNRMEAHLHQKFDHALGKLASRDATPAQQVVATLATTPAEDIAALLATPQGMQQAIVLGEIMRRPTDRW
jgi:hypothetical protein